jgi:hypothetical protein
VAREVARTDGSSGSRRSVGSSACSSRLPLQRGPLERPREGLQGGASRGGEHLGGFTRLAAASLYYQALLDLPGGGGPEAGGSNSRPSRALPRPLLGLRVQAKRLTRSALVAVWTAASPSSFGSTCCRSAAVATPEKGRSARGPCVKVQPWKDGRHYRRVRGPSRGKGPTWPRPPRLSSDSRR